MLITWKYQSICLSSICFFDSLDKKKKRTDRNSNAKTALIIFPSYLELEMAVAYWNLVLTGRFKFLDLWNRFLKVRKALDVSSKHHHSQTHRPPPQSFSGFNAIFLMTQTPISVIVAAFRKITSVLFPRTRGTCFWTLATWLQMTCQTTMRKVSIWGKHILLKSKIIPLGILLCLWIVCF